jgi:hypothetical protein
MSDPILKKAADLKRLADELKSPEVDKNMNEIMKILLEATQAEKGRKQ